MGISHAKPSCHVNEYRRQLNGITVRTSGCQDVQLHSALLALLAGTWPALTYIDRLHLVHADRSCVMHMN